VPGSEGGLGSTKTGVLFLSSPERPGADTFIHSLLIAGLDRSRFDIHLACSGGSPGRRSPAFEMLSAIPNVHVRPSNFGPSLTGRSRFEKGAVLLREGPSTLTDFVGLARYVREHRISVLHATDRPRDAVSCVLLGKLTGARSVVHLHVAYGDWMSRPVRWAFKNADALVAISQFVAGSLARNGYRPEKTHVVLNAIDPEAWDYRRDPGPVRREFGIGDSAPVIVCAARLFHWKGQADLLRAIAVVRQELPHIRVLIVGGEDRLAVRANFLAELRELARELGLLDHVVFTGFRADMRALLAASDVFALPSFEEPFGLVFLEAMAMRKPVVALDNGGTPEVVEHGKSGLLSPPRDVPALAANLLTLLRDPGLRARMGEYGRSQVEARFTPDRMARDTEDVYAALARTT
jgi:glycosyltransferase involved in cell wall biosynthesis